MFRHTIRHGNGDKARPGTAGRAVLRDRTGRTPGHPFYEELNQVLDQLGRCVLRTGVRQVLSLQIGATVNRAGVYFRTLVIGSSRGSAASAACVARVRQSELAALSQVRLAEATPDHVTISRRGADRWRPIRRCSRSCWEVAKRTAEGENNRHRRNELGGQCSDEVDRAA